MATFVSEVVLGFEKDPHFYHVNKTALPSLPSLFGSTEPGQWLVPGHLMSRACTLRLTFALHTWIPRAEGIEKHAGGGIDVSFSATELDIFIS